MSVTIISIIIVENNYGSTDSQSYTDQYAHSK